MQLIKGPEIPQKHQNYDLFRRMYESRIRAGLEAGAPLDPATTAYEYLDYLVESEGLLLHGSNRGDIERFEVRQPDEKSDGFAAQPGVFAASDGIWAMFFAIANRRIEEKTGRSDGIMSNMCAKPWPERRLTHRYYAFGLSDWWLAAGAWRDGWVYGLPRESFIKDQFSEQWVSDTPVEPVCKVPVQPDDFPFHEYVMGMSEVEMNLVVESSNAMASLVPGSAKPSEIPGGHRLVFDASLDEVEPLVTGLKRLIPGSRIETRANGGQTHLEISHDGETTELIEALLAQAYPAGS